MQKLALFISADYSAQNYLIGGQPWKQRPFKKESCQTALEAEQCIWALTSGRLLSYIKMCTPLVLVFFILGILSASPKYSSKHHAYLQNRLDH